MCEPYGRYTAQCPASLNSTIFPLPADVVLGDLHVYDPAAMAWTDLSAAASGTPPSARENQGFASTGGRIYVYGGKGEIGESWVRQEYERK